MAATQRKSGWRTVAGGFISRFIRRGFFRLVFLLFLLVVILPFAALNIAANRASANALLREVASQVFDLDVAEVTWDQARTEITGPDIALRGSITYYDVKIRRRVGPTVHPARKPLEYDFLTIPLVRIDYDLKRLPDLPVWQVNLSEGLVLHFNIHRGKWLDQELFVPGEGVGEPPTLPSIIVGGEAIVRLRADGLLKPPEELELDKEWYDFIGEGVRLVPKEGSPDEYQIGGAIASERFGYFNLGGTATRNSKRVEVRFDTDPKKEPLHFNRQYAAVLSTDILDTVEQFSIDSPETRLVARLLIEPEKDLQFDADVKASRGSICFVGFPLKVGDVTADIKVRNNNIEVDAIGYRGGATVIVKVDVNYIGEPREQLAADVNIKNLMVDEQFRLALLDARLQPDNMNYETGLPYPPGEFDPARQSWSRGYPEWDGPPPWQGGRVYPKLDSVFPFISRAFAPIGLADFELKFRKDGRDAEEDLAFRVFVRDATACFVGLPEEGVGFPVPLQNIYGVIEGKKNQNEPGRYDVRGYRPDELVLIGPEAAATMVPREEMAGALGPGEQVFIRAVYLDRTGAYKSNLRLNVSTAGVDFSKDMLSRLPPAVREQVEPFAPSGRVDVRRSEILITPGEDNLRFEFELFADGVIAQYQLPGADQAARFSGVRGTLLISNHPDRVQLSRVTGMLASSQISVELDYRDGSIRSLTLGSSEFGLTNELRAVLPKGVSEVLSRFVLRGFVKVTVMTPPEGGLDYAELEIEFLPGSDVRAAAVEFDMFSYPLTDVLGRVYVSMSPTQVEVVIPELTGRGQSDKITGEAARVSLDGHVIMPVATGAPTSDDGPSPIVNLNVRVAGLPIDAALIKAMTPLLRDDTPEGQKPALIAFVENLNVTGAVDVNGRFAMDAGGEMFWRFEIKLAGTGVNFAHFQLPITDMYGSIIIDGAEVRMSNVTGSTVTGSISLKDAGYSDEQGWWISASGRKLDFSNLTLRAALPQALRDTLARLNPVGEFDIDLYLNGQGERIAYLVSLDTWGINVDLGLHFDKMTGRFDVEGAIENGVQHMNGQMYIEEIYFKKARFNGLTSSIQHFGDRLEFPNLRGYFYDGWVEGRFGTLATDYTGEILVRAADLNKFSRTAFPDADPLVGAMDAEIRFHSKPDADGQIGRGRIDVQPFDRDSDDPARNTAKLAPVPLFSEIFRVIGDEHSFDEGHVFFWLGADRITIREMDFVSDSARVETFTGPIGGEAENWIMYDSGQMRLKMFFTLAPRTPIPLPLVQQILDLLKQILFPVFVTGTLNEPHVEIASLSLSEIERVQDEFPKRPRGG